MTTSAFYFHVCRFVFLHDQSEGYYIRVKFNHLYQLLDC